MTVDLITVDTVELRIAAQALRRASDEAWDLVGQLPREVASAPGWLAGWTVEELGWIRLELERLAADLVDQARALDARAAHVEQTDQRWWEIGPNVLQCGCFMPDGSRAVVPAFATAISAARGEGIQSVAQTRTVQVGGIDPGAGYGGGTGTVLVGGGVTAADLGFGMGAGTGTVLVGGIDPGTGYGGGTGTIDIGGNVTAADLGLGFEQDALVASMQLDPGFAHIMTLLEQPVTEAEQIRNRLAYQPVLFADGSYGVGEALSNAMYDIYNLTSPY